MLHSQGQSTGFLRISQGSRLRITLKGQKVKNGFDIFIIKVNIKKDDNSRLLRIIG